VVVLDRRAFDSGDGKKVGAATPAFVVGDVGDRSVVEDLLVRHRVDVVLHLAAEKSVSDSMVEPGRHLIANVGGALNLLEAMRACDVRGMVFSSSAAVYGTPRRLPVDEGAQLTPDNAYGAGKAMVEQALHWYHVSHGFSVASLRYFNAAGAAADGSLGEDGDHVTNLIPRVMRALAGLDEAVPVYGDDYDTPDGTAIRDYIHVEDLAGAHLLALELVSSRTGEWVFNLGTGRGSSVREVLDAAERAAGRPAPVRPSPRRLGDPAEVFADAGAAERDLGWHASRGLDEIVRSAWLSEERRARSRRDRVV
jgi:UDP-glucose-4-epimerase GalE